MTDRSTICFSRSAVLFLMAAGLFLTGCGKKEEKKVKLSYEARLALEYVNSLPEGQRNVLLYGSGSSEDQAQALANLSASGHMQGFAEYLEKTSSE